MECFSTAYLFYIGLQILAVSWTRLFLQQRCFGGDYIYSTLLARSLDQMVLFKYSKHVLEDDYMLANPTLALGETVPSLESLPSSW